MMCRHFSIILLGLAATAISVPARAASAETQITASYLYNLADFQGPVPSLFARITVDSEQGEVYTLDRSERSIQIYNGTAMQTYAFGEGLGLASANDLAAGDNGEMFVLYRHPAATVRHLDYRGQIINNLDLSHAGDADTPFKPDYLGYLNGKLYLADKGSMQVVIATTTGEIEQHIDFRQMIGEQIKEESSEQDLNKAQREKLREDLANLEGAELNGFHVDAQGQIYFTISSYFSAYRYSSGNKLEIFGTPGSAPGKFGVVASIATDRQGNIFVSDRLRCVVLMFDQALNFQSEFGYRGGRPENLVVPDDLALDSKNQRIYVAQAANRGVSVFKYRMN